MIHNKADEVIKELFQSHFCIYNIGVEASMKGSEFLHNCVQLLY